jgi:hypothetical protein
MMPLIMLLLLLAGTCFYFSFWIDQEGSSASMSIKPSHGFQVAVCNEIIPTHESDPSEIAEFWQISKLQNISANEANTIKKTLASSKRSETNTIPSSPYRDLIAVISNGNLEFSVARMQYEHYCRVSRTGSIEGLIIKVLLSDDAGISFVNDASLWQLQVLENE